MRERINVLKKLASGELTYYQAELILNLSKRQIIRLKRKFLIEGESGLTHGLVGKESNNRKLVEIREIACEIVQEKYSDFGPTLASEHLEADYGININKESLRQLMIKNHLWKAKKKRKQKYRSKRIPRGSYGEMVQYDGSYEHWLEDRGDTGEICILMGVDDATSQIQQIIFTTDEGINCTFDFWKKYLLKQGKPLQIYLDKFSTYKSPLVDKGIDREAKTQFGRAMEQLGINVIFANSPEAKGRVERRFGNLQDRLIKEMRLNGIDSIEEANKYVEDIFIPWFNKRYGKSAQTTQDLHQKLNYLEKQNLDRVLSIQFQRVVAGDFTISHNGKIYQLMRSAYIAIFRRDKVLVEERTNGVVKVSKDGKYLDYKILDKRPVRAKLKRELMLPRKMQISSSSLELRKRSYQRYLTKLQVKKVTF